MALVQQTVRLKLCVPQSELGKLQDTAAQYAEAFNAVAEEGWSSECTNGVELHRRTYRALRERLTLPSQLVITARMKAAEALKAMRALARIGKETSCPRTAAPAVRFDARCYRIDWQRAEALLTVAGGRLRLQFCLDRHAARFVGLKTCSAELLRRKRGWFLHVVVEREVKPPAQDREVVGVDRGIRRPAVSSSHGFFGNPRWKAIEERKLSLRQRLQGKSTRSAARHIKRLGTNLARFRRDCDHVLSKRLVQSCEPGDTLCFEDLKHIRSRVAVRQGAQRRRLHAWSFRRLGALVSYKAALRGVGVASVDPRDTSRRCPSCHHIDKRNRLTQSHFCCVRCGFSRNADLVASWNVRDRYEGRWSPVSAASGCVNTPHVEPSLCKPLTSVRGG